MTHKKIKMIGIEYDDHEEAFKLFFNGAVLETQRESTRFFKNLNQVGLFLSELHEKSNIEKEMMQSDLLKHLNQGAISSIKIYKGDENYRIIFNVKGVNVFLLTQKLKERSFKTVNAVISFLKSFFEEKIYMLENIELVFDDVNEEFKSEEGTCAYDKFILKLADPKFNF